MNNICEKCYFYTGSDCRFKKEFNTKYEKCEYFIGSDFVFEQMKEEAKKRFDKLNKKGQEIGVEEKEELLDYITRFIVNVEISDNGIYYVSFKNNTPYLDCIEIDKDHYNKFKKIKESQKGGLNRHE